LCIKRQIKGKEEKEGTCRLAQGRGKKSAKVRQPDWFSIPY